MRLMWAVLFLVIAAPAYAQQPVWVYLQPAAVHSGRIVTGERARPTFENDRAIPPAVLRKIARTGAHIRVASRWLQAVSVDADAAAIQKLQQLKEVRSIRRVGQSLPSTVSSSSASSMASASLATSLSFDSAFYGPNWKAINPLGVPSAHALGFTGKNIRVAILDGGFNPTHEALITRKLAATRDFINGDTNVRDQPNDFKVAGATDQEAHGTWVWSVLGGYMPGQIVGPAYDATFILAKVDVEQPSPQPDFKADEDRWVAAVEWADSMGARLISSSLAYKEFLDSASYKTSDMNGDITASARMADEAARRGILVVQAMGNTDGTPTSLLTPADADSILAVGAVDSLEHPASFGFSTTARGPTADGRLKPEVSALGKNIYAAQYNNVPAPYTYQSGTSMATPLVAGAAAIFMQAWPSLTIMAVRNALMLSGSRADFPDFDVGYGVPDVASAIMFPEGLSTVAVTTHTIDAPDVLTTIQPTFTWSAPLVYSSPQVQAPQYRLDIATDPTFNNIIYTDTTHGFSLTMKKPLRPALALWWRVVATVFPNITRSTHGTPPFTVPHWVKLLNFNNVNNTQTDSIRPVFRFEPLEAPAPSGPFTYDVEILNATSNNVVQSMKNLTTATVQAGDLTANIPYTWRVIVHSRLGVADTVASLGKFLVTSNAAPPATILYQNFPNPFPRRDLGETSTHIWFDVNTRSKIELAVYDMRGRLVKQLIPFSSTCGVITLDPGVYGRDSGVTDPCISTAWDGTDSFGKAQPRGVYMLRLRAGGVDQVKKILYLP